MLDLMNLKEDLKNGELLKTGDKTIDILTPLFRVSYPNLAELTSYMGSKEHFSVAMVFNARAADEPAKVDVTTVLLPAIKDACKIHGLSFDQFNPLKLGIKNNQAGEPIDGYPETCAWMGAKKYPKAKDLGVPCYSPTGQADFNPEAILAGYYARAKIQFYKPKQWQRLSVSLTSIQLIAEGETFGSGASPADTSMKGVEGAEEIKTDFETQDNAGTDTDWAQFK